jgi:transposase
MAKVFCGIDFHKRTSTLYAISEFGKEIEQVTTVRTDRLRQYLANRRDWKIGIEASGGTHHIVEELKKDSHEVVLINPNQFRGIGIGGKKTDERDAKALANALRLGFIPEVHHKSLMARRIKSLLVAREIFVRNRINMVNHIRGSLREYGITIPAGTEAFFELIDSKLTELDFIPLREVLITMLAQVRESQKKEKLTEQSLKELTQESETARRLQTIPGVGPMSAYGFLAVVDDITRFKDASQFAAYLGLVPTVSASADKRMMGNISRSGSEMLRRYLIHGARAWMRYSPEKGEDRNRIWAERVKGRRGMNKSVVALAHRIARIAYAVMRDQSEYQIKKITAKPEAEVQAG